jgi:hypothetical protein
MRERTGLHARARSVRIEMVRTEVRVDAAHRSSDGRHPRNGSSQRRVWADLWANFRLTRKKSR